MLFAPVAKSFAQDLSLSTGCAVDAVVFQPEAQVAVSLKSLSSKALACETSECPKFNPMGGMTRLDGFVVDRLNRDVVLWGLSQPGATPLMYDDFVIAIRAAYGQYTVLENGRSVRYEPGISIDADPSIWPKLHGADLSTPEGQAAYRQVCDTPMKLRVDGMPRHTRVSDILLAADFRMKLVNQGKATIPIDNFFKGISERGYERNRFALLRGAEFSQPEYDYNRYWFSAGKFAYQVSPDGATSFLDTAQVVLNQVAEFTDDRENDIVVEAERSYVCDWNLRMEDTYRAEQIWREMYNVFRHFAVARILVDSGALENSELDTTALLDTHRVARVAVPDSLPGSNFIIEQEAGGQHWFISNCGGVSVDVGRKMTRTGVAPEVGTVGSTVLSRRLGSGFAWDL